MGTWPQVQGRATRRNTIGITIEIAAGRREKDRPGGSEGQGNKKRTQHWVTEAEVERRERVALRRERMGEDGGEGGGGEGGGGRGGGDGGGGEGGGEGGGGEGGGDGGGGKDKDENKDAKGSKGGRKGGKCYVCDSEWHIATDCPIRKE